ncbi:MAG: glycosyltransferase family 4 protein [Mariniblastus sp.]|nr:glycosyltransferase family 4 protein [Mariniblastus sp.]
MPESPHRILFATDVPFWRMSDGAHQRIASLYRYLAREPHVAKVFFLGSPDADSARLAEASGVDYQAFSSDQPPEKLASRIQWYADATWNQARQWLTAKSRPLPIDEGPRSLELADFRWPWAIQRFREMVDQFQPDTIIFEYIKMGYLLEALTPEQRSRIHCVVDTHDILHRRAEQFFANGFPHWLMIDRDQEAEALRQFDLIMAIQEQEARTFREMVPEVETITVGHAVDWDGTPPTAKNPVGKTPLDQLRVGYIGSKNFSNWSAIRTFLQSAWPNVRRKNGDFCQLRVAGGICEWLEGQREAGSEEPQPLGPSLLQSVQLLGKVGAIRDFYDQIDVLINPVEFGTGLKIKNAEALRFGKLLITTTQGFDGMPETARLACRVVQSVEEMGEAINSLARDAGSIRSMQSLAGKLAQTEFSPEVAYSGLLEWIDRSNRNRPARFTAEQ